MRRSLLAPVVPVLAAPAAIGAIALGVVVGGMPATSAFANGSDTEYEVEELQPGQRALVQLPVTFQVLPMNRLYLYGERIEVAELALGPGDSLCLNGVPLLPRRHLTPGPPIDGGASRDWRFLAKVPYFIELTSEGVSMDDAASSYLHEQAEVGRAVRRAYAGYREAGLDPDAATQRTFEDLRDIDVHSLVDWSRDVRAETGVVCVWWKGLLGEFLFQLNDGSPTPEDRTPTTEEKRLLATHLYEILGLPPGPCWYFVTRGADITACGERNVAVVRSQIEAAREGRTPPEGPLKAEALLAIVTREER